MVNHRSIRENIKIAPSIIAGDFGCLKEEAQRIEASGADYLHLDIMDGNFVPNITFGPAAVSAINKATSMFLDVHLMIYHPYDYVERFVQAGADMLTFHYEATEDVEETLEFIRRCNIYAGLAFCPETPQSTIRKYLPLCDMLLIMTVHPGFGGQSFMPQMVEKIRFARDVCNEYHIRKNGKIAKTEKEKLPSFDIQVDGGINLETARQCVDAGANVLVAGTYLFQQKEMAEAVSQLANLYPQSKKS